MKKYEYDVSVIIPVYNVENFLGQCLDSLINQTHEFNKIEIILINDGSKDNSLQICNDYASKYTNIKVIDKENEGVSVARNTGLKQATGKYIMILDSDDFVSSNAVNTLYKFFEEHYDEVDIITYPIKFYYLNKRIEFHPRYNAFDKGTGIYDIDEYIYLNQSTVNIMFKNEQTITYDVTMKLSEDQKVDTQLIMKKKKIGYCHNAYYFYRRHGGGVSQNINSMIYCYESIMDYNEWLINTYTKNNILPRYIQSLILNTINWRLKTNQLIPYQFEGKEYDKAYKRILNLINHIDVDVITGIDNVPLIIKGHLLKLKKAKLKLDCSTNKIILSADGHILEEITKPKLELTSFYFDGNKLNISGIFDTLAFEIQKPLIKAIIYYKDGNKKEITCELKISKWSEKPLRLNSSTIYRIDEKINIDNIEKIEFKAFINKIEYPIIFSYKETTSYITESKKNIAHIKNKNYISILKRNITNIIKENTSKRLKKAPKKEMILRNICMNYYSNKDIWLYMDRRGIFDNAYLQFKHDITKNDGIKRYYIYDDDIEKIKNKFTKKEQKYLVKFKTNKHRKLFANCKLLITSFCDEVTYSPFGKNTNKYLDIIKHKLVYLQHGVLHANLQLMYGKEFTRINKFVISSDFEAENLTNNYLYNPEDFIKSGMPRLDKKESKIELKNKIIFAPTWRSYLIGPIANSERKLMLDKFIESSYFQKINEILCNEKLIRTLEKKDITLEFKLHPIFKGYKELFEIKSKNIKVECDEAILGEYKMFITDFSSFQFDFIKYGRPIIYFLPDPLEFKGGLHSYSELDLKYEKAFGDLYLDPKELTERIIKEINNDFKNSKKYSDRMKNFFYKNENCREKLYNELSQIR